ncbi:hypothetical protein [Photobacterium kishitanii]|uniref:Uncharacterized protein n=1 Tax=Photobacterium kishitanii TaxID=318456 RepID=A0A2T3KJ17_9GAMM|nr:hypothetical protein [Photobacterium kishitanii]PSU99267.1 hypothetical protein C9J27_09905 [Photobacterium kishitanii]
MELKIKNKREFDFYWYQLFSATGKNIPITPPNNFNRQSINLMKKKASELYNDIEREKLLFNSIKLDCENSLLSDNETLWFKQKNSRLIYWLWGHILPSQSIHILFVKFNMQCTNPPQFPDTNNSSFSNLFEKFDFNKSPYSENEKQEIILKYFDLAIAKKEDKISLINNMKSCWNYVKNFESFTWINNEDEQQIIWAIDYLLEYTNKNGQNIYIHQQIDFESNYYKFIFLFDIWSAHPDTKKFFIQSIKKAYSQKKFRDKQVGKKQCSFNLSQKSINQLALLAEFQGVPKNHILESLINNKILELGVK